MPKKKSQAGPTLFDDDRLPTAREMYADAVVELETVAPLAPAPDPLVAGARWRYRWPWNEAAEPVEILMVFPTSVCFVRVGRSRLEQTTLAIADFMKRAKPMAEEERC